jgi:hypothetical protein
LTAAKGIARCSAVSAAKPLGGTGAGDGRGRPSSDRPDWLIGGLTAAFCACAAACSANAADAAKKIESCLANIATPHGQISAGCFLGGRLLLPPKPNLNEDALSTQLIDSREKRPGHLFRLGLLRSAMRRTRFCLSNRRSAG